MLDISDKNFWLISCPFMYHYLLWYHRFSGASSCVQIVIEQHTIDFYWRASKTGIVTGATKPIQNLIKNICLFYKEFLIYKYISYLLLQFSYFYFIILTLFWVCWFLFCFLMWVEILFVSITKFAVFTFFVLKSYMDSFSLLNYFRSILDGVLLPF